MFQVSKLKIGMSFKREIPKLNRDNLVAWQGILRLHLDSIIDLGFKYLDTKYKTPIGTLPVEDIAEKKNNNIMMIDIASTLNYVKFDKVND